MNIDSGIVNSVYKSGLKVNKALNNAEYKMVPIIIAENEREKYAGRICYNKEDDKLYLVSYNFEELNDGDTSYLADTFTELLSMFYEKTLELKFPLETGRLETLEKQLKIKFPLTFKEQIKKYNGEGVEGKELYKIRNGEERDFSQFLNFNENPDAIAANIG